METTNGSHAWLYQYKPSRDAAWLKKLRETREVDWRITRWSSETRVGDLVFFWESGENGGFRGWGTVRGEPRPGLAEKGKKRIWRVPIRVTTWLPQPIARRRVLTERAFFDSNLFLSMNQGANFPLEPKEAENLLGLMPQSVNRPDHLTRLAEHPPSVPSAFQRQIGVPIDPNDSDEEFSGDPENPLPPSGSSADWPEWSIADLLSFPVTPAVEAIIRLADFRRLQVLGPVSTTRLLLAITDRGSWPELVEISSEEAGALAAVDSLVDRFQQPLNQLRESYMEDQRTGPPSGKLSFSDNALKVLYRAREMYSPNVAPGVLTIHLLIASLLTVRDGVVIDRLAKVNLTLADLQQQMLTMIAGSRPDLSSFWEGAFSSSSDGISRSPLTKGMPVAVVSNDNVLGKGQKDSLGADREAQAFAVLTLSKHFVPPLAVGIFGDWGAGKSFFMRLVQDHIERLSDEAKKPNGPSELLGDVVQIRFNAWHYVDTNLWASLVDHIFTELGRSTDEKKRSASNALLEQLTTARELTIESAERLVERRKEQSEAAKTVADAERKLLQMESSIGTSPQVYWEAVKAEFKVRIGEGGETSLKNAAAKLGLPGLVDDGKALSEAVHQLDEQRGNAHLLATGLRNQLGSWWNVLLFLVMCMSVAVLLNLLRDIAAVFLDEKIIREIWSQSVVTASSIVAAIGAVFAKASTQVRSALNTLHSFREKFEAAAKNAQEKPSKEVKDKQQELARLTAEVEEGRARLIASTDRLSQAALEYNAGNGKERLLSFVRSRAANKDYAKHLGLIATIRKDFEELSDLIAAATLPNYKPEPELERERVAYGERVATLLKSAKDGGNDFLNQEERDKLQASMDGKKPETLRSVNRIVLYIDDLDRCKPEKVSEVLQAVHMLLSFRLFVVFVAVDVRWVARSLRTSYPALLAKSNVGNKAAGATAHDYLEKIFQIPYWVRSMGKGGSKTFIEDRLETQRGALVLLQESLKAADRRESVNEPVEAGSNGNDRRVNAADFSIGGDYPISAPPLEDSQVASGGGKITEATRQPIPHVDLMQDERKFMVELAGWAGDSPRRLLRFMNVYQVMKASLSVEEAEANTRGGFFELMAQVAIATAAPQVLERWLTLLEGEPPAAPLSAILQKLKTRAEPDSGQAPLDEGLLAILELLVKHRPWSRVADIQRDAILTRRFSFGAEPLNLDWEEVS